MSGKCSDGNLAWIVNLCDESLAESGAANAGNAAAMYKALCDIVMLTMKVGYSIHGDVACGIIASKAKHALAKPPRNCDIYPDIARAEGVFCNGGCNLDCRFKEICESGREKGSIECGCGVRWLLAPAENGGAL